MTRSAQSLFTTIKVGVVCCVIGAACAAAWSGAAGATAPSSKFCDRLSTFSATLPSALTDVSAPKAGALARLLVRASAAAPKSMRASVTRLAKLLQPVSKATNDATRSVAIGKGADPYGTTLAVLRTYESKYCPAALPTSPNFGPITAASQTACLQDQATIKQAEDVYSTLNGNFGSMTDLVAAQFLRQVSSYYADVQVDEPPGGYTLIAVANGPCANVPVAG
jgi:hypothetical protein